ncbi:MAG: aminoacyl-tRNA hydrolase [Oscillospiraceae bacterium]|jgi:PTH1 family peptidyl-tRNA hydrolase|nr:aminoacyl-tRNA hydrolase [Oscillospiraceae bacterium]
MLLFGKNTPSWLVVFLGNPGDKYVRTRHNAGWLAADAVENFADKRIKRVKFKSLTEVVTLGGKSVLLIKPQTFMNLSGDAVAPAARFYKIPPERVVVVHDDLDLPPGKLRIKRGGSDGGHNGLKSIIARLGSKEFPRIKLGIGKPEHSGFDTLDWVIGKISSADFDVIKEAAARVPEVLEILVRDGTDAAMNKFNGIS